MRYRSIRRLLTTTKDATTLAWSSDGSLLATASAKGTVIRVHRMPGAGRSHSFRRGAMSATIQSMAFGPVGQPVQLLVAASSHGTVHVFRLEEPEPPGVLPRPTSAAVGLLSAVVRYSVGDMVEPARNIATIRLPQSVGIAICAFRSTRTSPLAAAAASAENAAALVSPGLSVSGGSDRGGSAGLPSQGELAGGTPVGPTAAIAAAAAVVEGGGGTEGPAGACGGVAGLPGHGHEAAGGQQDVRATIMVATQEGLLYEYSLTDLLNPQGPKCNLDGEWSMLGSGSILG